MEDRKSKKWGYNISIQYSPTLTVKLIPMIKNSIFEIQKEPTYTTIIEKSFDFETYGEIIQAKHVPQDNVLSIDYLPTSPYLKAQHQINEGILTPEMIFEYINSNPKENSALSFIASHGVRKSNLDIQVFPPSENLLDIRTVHTTLTVAGMIPKGIIGDAFAKNIESLIFKVLLQEGNITVYDNKTEKDSFVFVVGNKNKTYRKKIITIPVSAFTNKKEAKKIALDYYYRKSDDIISVEEIIT